MATSGSYNFATSRDEITKYAFFNLALLNEGGDLTASQITEGSFFLNILLKAWQEKGMPLWALKSGYILPLHDTNSFSVGTGSTSHVVTSYVTTSLSANAAAAATALTVSSISGISNADAIGIELDSGNIHWTTVNGAPSGSTVTITAGLATAATSGSRVYAYTTTNRIQRPLKIVQAFRRDMHNNNDVPMWIYTRDEYLDIPNKTIEGPPLALFYDPQIGTAAATAYAGVIYQWPRYQNGDFLVGFTYQQPFADMDSGTDELDFPQEFYLAVIWNLSAILLNKYAIPEDKAKIILSQAKQFKDEAFDFSVEEGSYRIQPDTQF